MLKGQIESEAANASAPGLEVCVNACCFAWGTPLESFVKAVGSAGFRAVEVPIQQVVLMAGRVGGLNATARALGDAGVVVEEFSGLLPDGDVLPSPLLIDETRWSAALETIDDRLTTAEAIGCSGASIVCNPRTHMHPDAARAVALERLSLLAERAAAYRVRLGVEFIGVERSLDASLDRRVRFVSSLGELHSLLRELNAPNVAILLDTCHLYASGGRLEDVLALEDGSIEFVHVSDVPLGVDPQAMEDSMRLLPGEGTADLSSLLAAIQSKGYSRPVSIEVFSSDLARLPSRELVERLIEAARFINESSSVAQAHLGGDVG